MRRFFLLAFVISLFAAPCPAQQKETVKAIGWGSLSGKVTFEGDLPPVVSFVPEINKLMNNQDKACCNAAPAKQKISPKWTIDAKNRGVANIAVFLKAPPGMVFPIHVDDMVRKDTVILDQPFCAFLPHVIALYPQYHNGMKEVATGQKFIMKNSSVIGHNVRGTTQIKYNAPFNINMPSKDENKFTFNPQPLPITVQCDYHKWMDAYVFVFDHPYCAITQADGSFAIPRVPAGVEVTIMAWHEADGWALTNQGKTMLLKGGKNELNLTIKAK